MMRKIRKIVTGCLLAGCLLVGNAGEGQAAPILEEFDTYGEYHAALGLKLETNPRIFRDAYYEQDAPALEEWGKLLKGNGDDDVKEELAGEFKDIKIKGNGKYTVKLKNAEYDGGSEFRKLYVATDIPNSGEVTFKNLVVKIDGEKVAGMKKPVLDTTDEYSGHCVLLVLHPSNEAVKDVMEADTVPQSDENLLEISFEVEGFSYDKGEAAATPTPEPTATPEPEQIPEEEPFTEDKTDQEAATEKSSSDTELSAGRKAGIVITIIVAIGGIVTSLVVVNQRKH